MMRKLFKIVVIVALLFWAAAGLRHAQGQRDSESITRSTSATVSNRPQVGIRIYATDGGGSFALKNSVLEKMAGSTILKGNIVNLTKRKREQVSFSVRAYGRDGQLLKGLESETVFTTQELKANASVPINHGYGVWLQGILADDIARIEISEISQAQDIPIMARLIPFPAHALALERYSDVEE
jgi:hypothetical protein